MRWGMVGRALAVAGLVAGVAGCDWLQHRFDAGHTGHNPAERTLGPATVGRLELAWSAATGGTGDPVVTDGAVFVSSRTRLQAYEAGTGAVRWTVDRGGPIPDRDPVLTEPAATGDGTVLVGELSYFGSGGVSGAVLGFDARTGEPVGLPIHDVDRPVQPNQGPPTVVGDEIFGPFALRIPLAGPALTGQVGLLASGRTMMVNEPPPNTPGPSAVAGGVLYQVDAEGNLEAFDAAGEAGCAPNPSGPADLYVCDPLWSAPIGTGVDTPVVAAGLVLAGGGDAVAAFEAGPEPASTSPVWTAAVPGATTPAVAAGTAYAGSRGGLVALDLDECGDGGGCAPAWTGATGGPVTAPPTVANGVVYVAAEGGRLLAFAAAGCGAAPAATCEPLWEATAPAPVRSALVVAGGRLFVRTTGGELLAYALPPS